MRIPLAVALSTVAVLALVPEPAASHCEIPCGIYDDEMRFMMIDEHLKTIEKSMAEIERLTAASPQGETSAVDENQLVRWVMNKEDHAAQLTEILTTYFLDQRIKPVDAGAEGRDRYLDLLEIVHRMMVQTMKCKQTVDPAHVAELRDLREQLHTRYHAER